MDTLSIKIRYRPLRIGWCVRSDDFEALRKAMRMSFALWGGMYNPIIPVDRTPLSENLVSTFRVDALWPVTEDAVVVEFTEKFKHLPSPFFHKELFLKYDGENIEPQVLDITHSIEKLYKEHFKNNQDPEGCIELYSWDEKDNLADVFLATYGGFLSPEITGTDYGEQIRQLFRPSVIQIENGVDVPVPNANAATASTFSMAYIGRHHVVRNYWSFPGFYVGSASEFSDLVNFWNLRAADTNLMFFDPDFGDRLAERRRARLEHYRSRPPSRHEHMNRMALWSREELPRSEAAAFGEGLTFVRMDDGLWNGLNIRAPFMYFSEESILASVDEGDQRRTSISFMLPNKPVSENRWNFHQYLVASIDIGIGLFGNDASTLHTPYLPFLNEYYGRECFFEWNRARVEPETIGCIIRASDDDIRFRSLNIADLIREIFAYYGIVAKPSKPGLIANRLIRQMGGLGGCRVFKIAGVRRLIEEHGPQQSFTRGRATRTILGEGTDKPISLYRTLYIEPRPGKAELTTDSVFSYLLRSGIFRAGLRFECPSCQLEFWISLDDVRTSTICEYCGNQFNVTPLLKDRDWAYRRSGLFGRDDHQEGAIPVVLLLQQLDTILHREAFYATATLLESSTNRFRKCETDFIVVNRRGNRANIELAIGECKTAGEITDDDIEKLESVLSCFPTETFDSYIIFAKLNPYTTDEINRIRQAYVRLDGRIIMLSADELEPYYAYENHPAQSSTRLVAVNLSDMARHSWTIFLKDESAQGDGQVQGTPSGNAPPAATRGRRRRGAKGAQQAD